MHLILELAVNAEGQFEGTVDGGAAAPTPFAGTLELLKVLQDLTTPDGGQSPTAEGPL